MKHNILRLSVLMFWSLVSGFIVTLSAQPAFINKHIEEVYTAANSAAKGSLPEFYVQKNQDDLIEHVGLKLFDQDLMADYGEVPLRFVERYLLELLAVSDKSWNIDQSMKFDNVQIWSDIYTGTMDKVIRQFAAGMDASVSIMIASGQFRYEVKCIKDHKLAMSISFPARYEMLTGYTKLEAEEAFLNRLQAFCLDEKAFETPTVNVDMLVQAEGDDPTLLTVHDMSYVIDAMRSACYYKKQEDGSVIALWDDDHRLPSLYNLFNSLVDYGVDAEVEQGMYNGKNEFKIPVVKLMRYMKNEGCMIYTGFKEMGRDEITGIVSAVNTELGYQHQIQFSCPKVILDDPQAAPVRLHLFAYVPIHHMQNMQMQKN